MTRRKQKASGGRGIGERFVPLVHSVLTSPAWADLSPLDRCLYIELRGLVRFPACENNGELFLSLRDAAKALKTGLHQAQRAFYSLQRHGFAIVNEVGHLGAEGYGKATTYRLTCCACRQHPRGSREFLNWQPGADFPVVAGSAKTKPRCRSGNKPDAGAATFSETLMPERHRPDAGAATHVARIRPVPDAGTATHSRSLPGRGAGTAGWVLPSKPSERSFAVVRSGQATRIGVRSVRRQVAA